MYHVYLQCRACSVLLCADNAVHYNITLQPPTLCALTWTMLALPLSVPSSEWRIWWVEWEMELRPDSNYPNILFPCDVNIILNWKIGELKCFFYFPCSSHLSDYAGLLEMVFDGTHKMTRYWIINIILAVLPCLVTIFVTPWYYLDNQQFLHHVIAETVLD